MADANERRPLGKGGAHDVAGSASVLILADGPDVAVALRRRREASWRLPPLRSGHRDPLDSIAGLPIIDKHDRCRGMFSDGGRWMPCCRNAA